QAKLDKRSVSKISATTSSKYKKLYEKERRKITILNAELSFKDDLEKSNKLLSVKIAKLEKQLVYKDKLLKTKEKTHKKTNTMPKLMMKKEFKQEEKVVQKVKTKKVSNDKKIITFKARSFRLNTDSIIYDGINGKKISKWVETTSFTSTQKTDSWIKITGYFVDKKWRSAKKEMWIKKAQVSKR
ncbi:MAG: hypothetical protein DRG78_13915, partial [Epsilonproteobacteria bacterium]